MDFNRIRNTRGQAMEEKKELTRREFLGWAAAAAVLALLPGCEPAAYHADASPGRARRLSATTGTPYASAYGTGQPYVITPQPAVANANYIVVQEPTVIQAAYVPPQTAPVRQPAAPRRPVAAIAAPSSGKLRAVSRQSWATVAPNPNKMKAMDGVTRITIHHEGSSPNIDATPSQVAATLRKIQGQHKKRMGAGDIGYHYVIDRTGTIWQGRDSKYQGAHTSGANAHNVGIMLLGNFESQQPTERQLSSMRNLVLSLSRLYNLNLRTDIYAHNDFGNTQCPGKNLKPHVTAFKMLR